MCCASCRRIRIRSRASGPHHQLSISGMAWRWTGAGVSIGVPGAMDGWICLGCWCYLRPLCYRATMYGVALQAYHFPIGLEPGGKSAVDKILVASCMDGWAWAHAARSFWVHSHDMAPEKGRTTGKSVREAAVLWSVLLCSQLASHVGSVRTNKQDVARQQAGTEK
jgi:hypothetical protein